MVINPIIVTKDKISGVRLPVFTPSAIKIKENSDIGEKFVSEEDISEGHAVNKGVLLASGKYIKLLTDDDYFYREAIEKAVVKALTQVIEVMVEASGT